jgi:hypothetical protein
LPLINLLYRCPRCGHGTMEGAKDQARCPECGVVFARSGEGGLIFVREPSGGEWDVPGTELTAAISAWEDKGCLPGTEGEVSEEGVGSPRKEMTREAEVLVRSSGNEAPVFFGGSFMGFAEAMGKATSAKLRLTEEGVEVEYHEADTGEKNTSFWPFFEIRAVQTSSSSLQFSPSSGGLLEFRFLADSSYRWERLLRNAIRRAYRKAGLGEILEFQPRIVVE